jgi:protein phosphatase
VAGYNNIEYAGLSDVGVRRSHNQDAYALLPATGQEQWQERGHMFLVADGMGAHAVGELASKMAADAIPHIYTKHAEDGPAGALRRAFLEANTTIHTRGQQNRDFEGMGTTSTALLLRPEGAWISHVGDSRAYRIRDGQLEQLSFDHSLVWEIARRQRCNPEDLPGIPTNVIVRSLGPEPLVQVDVEGPHPIQTGDIYLLCSDGLSGPLEEAEIGAVAAALPPAEACRVLVDLANLQGGPDNITVIIIRVGETNGPSSSGTRARARGRKQARRLDKATWPLLGLIGGIALSVAAILLARNGLATVGVAAFVLSVLTLAAGLAGAVALYKRQVEAKPEVPDTAGPPRVYRQTSCVVDQALLERMVGACKTLEQRVHDAGLTVDYEEFHQHQRKAAELREQKQLGDAFREACLALWALSNALQRNRGK